MDINTTQIKSRSSHNAANGSPAWKRAFDFVILFLTAPIWLPISCCVALAIRIGSSGPIFFRQERVGYRGHTFTCFKFRTMKPNAEQETHRSHVKDLITSSAPMTKLDSGKDARLIPGGNWIRAAGLDELPQIINIFKGEMSIVGPRPCIPYEYALYEPWQRSRCDAPPGLTGLWQVSGKNRTTFEQMVRFDIEYARRMSLWLDVSIVARTAPAILRQVSDLVAAKRSSKAAAPVAPAPIGSTSVTSVSTQKVLI
jgi:lipopolysaccharide/colanic/teichoic acid biosynthesis glycosyltransferase